MRINEFTPIEEYYKKKMIEELEKVEKKIFEYQLSKEQVKENYYPVVTISDIKIIFNYYISELKDKYF